MTIEQNIHVSKLTNILLQIILILLVLYRSAFYSMFVTPNFYGVQYFLFVLIPLYIIVSGKYRIPSVIIFYTLTMIIGALFHIQFADIESPFTESFMWISVILIMIIILNTNYRNKLIVYFFVVFFFIEIGMCIYEKINRCFIITGFESNMTATSIDLSEYTSIDFRSRALLYHPLFNANVISIFLGFLLCDNHLKRNIKLLIIAAGLFALFCCNSRGALLVWILLLAYRYIFYNNNIIKTIVIIISIYIFLPTILDILSLNGGLGRLNFDFDDKSSETRLLAYGLFSAYPWNFDSIVYGGNIIYYPLTEVSLENGILLNLSYWGWIIGTLKTILEFVISYLCLSRYTAKEKFIILSAFWGVAMFNNNSFNAMFLTYFCFINVAFNSLKNGYGFYSK